MKTPTIRTLALPFLVGILVGTVQPSAAAEPVVGVCSNAPDTNMVVEMVKSPVVMKSLINSRNPFVYTVGTDTNGVPIQQVEWLYRKGDLKEQKCPIWAGSLVTLVREEDGAVRVRCDKTALPDEEKYHQFILKGNIVTGWLKKESVIKVKVSDWRENGKGTATSTPKAVFDSLVSEVAAIASHHAELAGFADYASGRESELNVSHVLAELDTHAVRKCCAVGEGIPGADEHVGRHCGEAQGDALGTGQEDSRAGRRRRVARQERAAGREAMGQSPQDAEHPHLDWHHNEHGDEGTLRLSKVGASRRRRLIQQDGTHGGKMTQ